MKVDFTHDGAAGTVNFGIGIRDQSMAEAESRMLPGNGRPDENGAQRFARLLSGLPTLDYEELKKLVPNEPLPEGFEHYRAFNAATGDPFNMGNRLGADGKQLSLHTILFGVLRSPLLIVSAWTQTRKRANILPGFLDLDISIITTGQTQMPCWRR